MKLNKRNIFFSRKDISDLREEFWTLLNKEQKSYRQYSREIGIGKVGGVLIGFLHAERGTEDYSLMKIKNYLDSKKNT